MGEDLLVKGIRVAKPPDKGLNAKELDDNLELGKPGKCKVADTGWKRDDKDRPTRHLMLESCAAPQPRSRLIKVVFDKEEVHDDDDHMHHERVP